MLRSRISSACPVHVNRVMDAAPYLVYRYESAKETYFLKRQSSRFKENLIRSVIKRWERLIDKHTHQGGNHRLMIKGGDEQKP